MRLILNAVVNSWLAVFLQFSFFSSQSLRKAGRNEIVKENILWHGHILNICSLYMARSPLSRVLFEASEIQACCGVFVWDSRFLKKDSYLRRSAQLRSSYLSLASRVFI